MSKKLLLSVFVLIHKQLVWCLQIVNKDIFYWIAFLNYSGISSSVAAWKAHKLTKQDCSLLGYIERKIKRRRGSFSLLQSSFGRLKNKKGKLYRGRLGSYDLCAQGIHFLEHLHLIHLKLSDKTVVVKVRNFLFQFLTDSSKISFYLWCQLVCRTDVTEKAWPLEIFFVVCYIEKNGRKWGYRSSSSS